METIGMKTEEQEVRLSYLEKCGLKNYEPHHRVCIEKNDYIIKTADSPQELLDTFALRYEVYGPYYKTPPPVPLDIDKYDPFADHIIVKLKSTEQIVGTYRLLCSDFTQDFYTAREFDLSSLLSRDGKLVEMGRATVSEELRSGVVITLLWRGIADYILGIKADYLFGCATLWTQDPISAAETVHCFQSKDLTIDFELNPYEENILPGLESELDKLSLNPKSEKEVNEIERSLPPLFKSYIKANAKFGVCPANDRKLQSIDFFSLVRVSDLSPALAKRYLTK